MTRALMFNKYIKDFNRVFNMSQLLSSVLQGSIDCISSLNTNFVTYDKVLSGLLNDIDALSGEIDSRPLNFGSYNIVVVNELPSNPDSNTIYMIPEEEE